MEILVILAPLALLLGLTALIAFMWAVRKGQYDDLSTPANRILLDDEIIEKNNNNSININNSVNEEKGLKQ